MTPPFARTVAWLALLLGAAARGPAQTTPPARRPSVVLLRTDDQDARSMVERRPTDELVMRNVNELLVALGTTFSNSFVTCSLCCPSRATFLTGQLAHHHGVVDNVAPRGGYAKLDHRNTLPVWLHDAGWCTAHVGKYLNGYGAAEGPAPATPPDPTAHDAPPAGTTREIPPGWSRWFTSFLKAYDDYYVNDDGTIVHFGTDESDYFTDVVARKAVDFVTSAPADKPFLLVLDFSAPHDGRPWPFGAGGEDLRPKTPAPAFPEPARRHDGLLDHFVRELPPSFDEADVSDKPRAIRDRTPRLDATRLAQVDRRYRKRLESLLAVDEAVKQVVDALERSGRLADTYVFFTSDNGFLQGEHRLFDTKLYPYEESIRVPLVVRGPGVPAGQVVDRLVTNADLAPTIAAIAQVEPRLPQDGRSLLPLFVDPKSEWRSDFLVEGGPWKFDALRNERNLYVEWHFEGDGTPSERELYDLVDGGANAPADPGELDNRAGRADHAALVETLAKRLAVLRHEGDPHGR
jgi:arylsulfatase A-like enzyme